MPIRIPGFGDVGFGSTPEPALPAPANPGRLFIPAVSQAPAAREYAPFLTHLRLNDGGMLDWRAPGHCIIDAIGFMGEDPEKALTLHVPNTPHYGDVEFSSLYLSLLWPQLHRLLPRPLHLTSGAIVQVYGPARGILVLSGTRR